MNERAANDTQPPAAAETGLPGFAVAATLMVSLALLFWLAGAYEPDQIPGYASSPRQITGMALMLTLLPPYVLVAASIGQRRSLALVHELRARLPEPSAADSVADALRGALRRTWLVGSIAGLLMGLLNTQPLDAVKSEVPILDGVISLGQMTMWWMIGLLMGVRFTAARAFRRLAEIVRLDLMRPDRMRAIARSGVVDVAIVAGALLFTPLQSLDAEFRWYNYSFGLLVALPAVTFFVVWPLQPLHRRNREDRDARIARVDHQLTELATAAPTTAEASVRLETLLAHRDRLREAPTWPLSMALLSRVLLYLVIPPLAWAGAAIVERVVDTLLAG